ncbi:hypothetical protein BG842_09900 [Haladaptatus sp. W1]|uniref:hypothetical protein n=1 Tax=Haladaptatus sp. W1 TaxID=1897478 RepID=UPI000849BFBF|nr:hypothetical protein [Haladaptatus sp. W1]ODR83248.1 hypothetical protein BG842_09900 [Haladaptatus sp. W1]
MSPPPTDDGVNTTGPPDRQTLRLLEQILADEPTVAATEFAPDSYEPRLLRTLLDTGRYPSTVDAARLEIRWFSTGDFSIHYIETHDDDHWECRWNRHPNSHTDRLHFHQPLDGNDVEDISLESVHPLDVLSTVLAAIEQRIAQQWEAQSQG